MIDVNSLLQAPRHKSKLRKILGRSREIVPRWRSCTIRQPLSETGH